MCATTHSQKSETIANENEHIPRRTVRAATEGMAIDAYAHPKGSGLFDVHSASGSVYEVDLKADLRGEQSCTCPDVEHNLRAGERCKHATRVRLALGIDACPVELIDARDSTLKANMRKFGAEPTVEQQAAAVAVVHEGGRAVATDGGAPSDRGRDGHDTDGGRR